MTDLIEITTDSFEQEVLASPIPVLVDFSAEWCAPCKAALPLLRDVGAEYATEARVVKVDIDRSREIGNRYGVQALPTFLLFSRGEVVEKKNGIASRSELCAMIDRAMESADE